jgi:hypothetical protein
MTDDGTMHLGKLLYTNDSTIVLWNSELPYDKSKILTFARMFNFSNIEQIIIIKEGRLWSGIGKGFLIGTLGGTVAGLIGASTVERYQGIAFLFCLGVGSVTGILLGGIIGTQSGVDDEF